MKGKLERNNRTKSNRASVEGGSGNKIEDTLDKIEVAFKQMSSENGVKELIQPIFKKNLELQKSKKIEVAFLGQNEMEFKIINDWLNLDELGLNGESQSLILGKSNWDVQSYSFEERPVRAVSDISPLIQIIVYDETFKSRPNFTSILKELTVDIPCVFLLTLLDNDEDIASLRLKLFSNCIYAESFNKKEIVPNGFVERFRKLDFVRRLKYFNLYNRTEDLINVSKLLEHNLKIKTNDLSSDYLLSEKQLIENKFRENEISSKDLNELRLSVSKGFRNISKSIEDGVSDWEQETEGSFLKKLKDSVEGTDKFYEQEGVKNITLKVPEGVLDNLKSQTSEKLSKEFQRIIHLVKGNLDVIQKEVKRQFQVLGIGVPMIVQTTLSESISDEILDQNLHFSRGYEKQINKKGISHLMMEIRTPLFMIMPLMMFVGLFGSFFTSEDRGIISGQTSYQEKQAIIIEKLPDFQLKKHGGFKQFAENELYSKRYRNKLTIKNDEGSQYMFEERVKKIETIAQYTKKKKIKTESKLNYLVTDDNSKLVIFLHERANRNEVIDILENPESGFLVKVESGGGMGGYSALGKIAPALGKYKFFVLGGLVLLLGGFIRKKKSDFAEEKTEIRDREKKTMRQALKQDVEKIYKTSIARWRSKVIDYAKEQETNLLMIIDNSLNQAIEQNKIEVRENMARVERRMKNSHGEKEIINKLRKELKAQKNLLQAVKFQIRDQVNAV